MNHANIIRRDSPSLSQLLVRIVFSRRLPVSLAVLAVLANQEECSLMEFLRTLKCEIREIGSILFLISVPSTAIEFFPAQTFSRIEEVRDAVLKIMSFPLLLEGKNSKRAAAVPRVCEWVTLDACKSEKCMQKHFQVDFRPNKLTDPTLGFCSYLNLCANPRCKYVHLKPEEEEKQKVQNLENASWIKCDIRSFPLWVFSGLVAAVLLDPPWDIHMELSYGTLTDDELRALPIESIHNETHGGFVFLWATSRTVEVARDCLRLWGYSRVDEIIWIKVNQIMGTVRSGRTGHWLNHNKEHCMVGIKGDVSWAEVGRYRQDCDVIVAPVRENSRKPDEIYKIIDRLVRGKPCLELFGRNHNRRPGWITLGNQLDDSSSHVMIMPELAHRLSSIE